MGVGLALLAASLAPVLDGHWLVGFHHVCDLQFRVDLRSTREGETITRSKAWQAHEPAGPLLPLIGPVIPRAKLICSALAKQEHQCKEKRDDWQCLVLCI